MIPEPSNEFDRSLIVTRTKRGLRNRQHENPLHVISKRCFSSSPCTCHVAASRSASSSRTSTRCSCSRRRRSARYSTDLDNRCVRCIDMYFEQQYTVPPCRSTVAPHFSINTDTFKEFDPSRASTHSARPFVVGSERKLIENVL